MGTWKISIELIAAYLSKSQAQLAQRPCGRPPGHIQLLPKHMGIPMLSLFIVKKCGNMWEWIDVICCNYISLNSLNTSLNCWRCEEIFQVDHSSSIGWGPSTEIYTVADRPAGGRSCPSSESDQCLGFFHLGRLVWSHRIVTSWKKRPLDEKRLVCIHLQAFTVGKSSESYKWLVHIDTADIYNGYSQQVLSIMSVLQKPPVAQDTCVSEQEVLECWIVCHVDAKARPYTLGLCQKLTLHTCHMQLLSERLGFAAWNSSFFHGNEDRTDQNAGSNGRVVPGSSFARNRSPGATTPRRSSPSPRVTNWVRDAMNAMSLPSSFQRHGIPLWVHHFHMSFNAWETVLRQGNQNFHDPFMWTLISSNKNLQSTETLMEHIS